MVDCHNINLDFPNSIQVTKTSGTHWLFQLAKHKLHTNTLSTVVSQNLWTSLIVPINFFHSKLWQWGHIQSLPINLKNLSTVSSQWTAELLLYVFQVLKYETTLEGNGRKNFAVLLIKAIKEVPGSTGVLPCFPLYFSFLDPAWLRTEYWVPWAFHSCQSKTIYHLPRECEPSSKQFCWNKRALADLEQWTDGRWILVR